MAEAVEVKPWTVAHFRKALEYSETLPIVCKFPNTWELYEVPKFAAYIIQAREVFKKYESFRMFTFNLHQRKHSDSLKLFKKF